MQFYAILDSKDSSLTQFGIVITMMGSTVMQSGYIENPKMLDLFLISFSLKNLKVIFETFNRHAILATLNIKAGPSIRYQKIWFTLQTFSQRFRALLRFIFSYHAPEKGSNFYFLPLLSWYWIPSVGLWSLKWPIHRSFQVNKRLFTACSIFK